MKFGPMALPDALDAILAHTLQAGGITFVRGRRLTADDLRILGEHGAQHVMAARLEGDDIGRDAAAGRVVGMLAGSGLRAGTPKGGYCDLIAQAAGLLRIDVERVRAFNAVDEALTLATLAPHDAVAPGQVVATAAVAPFGLPEARLAASLDRLAGGPAMDLAEYQPFRASLLLTRDAFTSAHQVGRTIGQLAERLAGMDGTLAETRDCPHDEAALGAHLTDTDSGADIVLIAGATATLDRGDVLPRAITAAGGTIERFGMPGETAGHLVWAHLEGRPVVVLPGTARRLDLRTFEPLLRRFAAGLEISSASIAAFGVGGWLTGNRPAEDEELPTVVGQPPPIAAVLLTRGTPGSEPGLGNEPPIRKVAKAALASRARPVIVVGSHGGEAMATALFDMKDVHLLHNPRPELGMAEALRVALAAVPADAAGALVQFTDLPLLRDEDIDLLISAFAPDAGRALWVPTFRGRRGQPILFDRRFFGDLAGLRDIAELPALLGRHEAEVHEVATDHPGVLMDMDTVHALTAWSATG